MRTYQEKLQGFFCQIVKGEKEVAYPDIANHLNRLRKMLEEKMQIDKGSYSDELDRLSSLNSKFDECCQSIDNLIRANDELREVILSSRLVQNYRSMIHSKGSCLIEYKKHLEKDQAIFSSTKVCDVSELKILLHEPPEVTDKILELLKEQ